MTLSTKSKFLLTSLCVLTTIIVVAGCSPKMPKITETVYPNKVAENAKISDEYKDVANELSEYAISQFYEISKIPHCNGNEWALLDWLANWGKTNNLKTTVDASKCVYIDVPATMGMENAPKIILQAHADMVEKTIDPKIDMKTTGIDLVMDENGAIHSRENKTTIGSDDGEGIVTALAIAKSDKIKHGPLRMIFTYDEENGCEGAKNLTNEALDAPYLINIDGNFVGQVFCESGGSQRATLSKTFATQPMQNATELTVEISGLEGGHSALDIEKKRANANIVCRDLLTKMISENIEFNIVSFIGGASYSSICDSAKLVINVAKTDSEKAKNIINDTFNESKSKYSDDKNPNYALSEKDASQNGIAYNDCKTFINSMNSFQYGVNKWSEKFDGLVETSSNIPVVKVQDGNAEYTFGVRSSVNEDMHTKMDFAAQTAKKYGFDCQLSEFMNAWPSSSDSKIDDLMVESYKNACGFEGVKTGIHGIIECSDFLVKKPDLKMIGIGADVANEHGVTETFFTKSLPAHFASIVYLLENANKLK